jgi:hypothetical protein
MHPLTQDLLYLEKTANQLNSEIFSLQGYRISLTSDLKLIVLDMHLSNDLDIDVAEMQMKLRNDYLSELLFDITEKLNTLDNTLDEIENLNPNHYE